MRKMTLAFLLAGLGGIAAPYAYAAGTGAVEFKGKIIEASCELKSKNQIVPLGIVRIADLRKNQRWDSSLWASFQLEFENCPAEKNIHITFGDAVLGVGPRNDLFPLTPDSTAKGVGVRITGGTSTYAPGSKNNFGKHSQLRLSAHYEMTGDIKEVKPGDANVITDIKITHK